MHFCPLAELPTTTLLHPACLSLRHLDSTPTQPLLQAPGHGPQLLLKNWLLPLYTPAPVNTVTVSSQLCGAQSLWLFQVVSLVFSLPPLLPSHIMLCWLVGVVDVWSCS